MILLRILLLTLATLTAQAQPRAIKPLGSGGKRVALVVGNDTYRAVQPLTNAARDARAMAQALQETGFGVTLLTNATREALEEGVDKFIARIQPHDVALFYYSGHAVQIGGENYLSPVDLVAANEVQVRTRSLKASEVLEQMEARSSDLQIVILDACRNNPFGRDRAIGSRGGLAAINAGKGTFLAYATAPGKTADDNLGGQNGLYTASLLKMLRQPGLTLEQVFKQVGGDVQRASNGRQVPWISFSVEGDFYFRPGLSNAAGPATNTCADAWGMVRESADAAALRAFAQDFGECAQEVRLAKLKLTTLERRADAPPVQEWVQERTNPKDGLKYVWIPPGSFQMGCSPGDKECLGDESPAHTVRISRGFYLGQTEVTQAAYERVTGTNPSNFKGSTLPVEQVSQEEAVKYCSLIGGRLPTEAEWEYAARGGVAAARYGALDEIAWYSGNSGGETHPVATKKPNAYGLYDMLGNAWEWTSDWYGDYSSASQTDPKGATSGRGKALRGGSWYNDPTGVRSSGRVIVQPGYRYIVIGFRCLWE